MHSVFASHACAARATAVALAALFAAPALAFEIDVGNPDIEMRWDNTFRYNLGGRVQEQNPAILGAVEQRRRRPQLQQRLARHQPPRHPVRVRLRVAEELRRARERGAVVRQRLLAASTTPTPRPPTRWSTACPRRACCRRTASATSRDRRASGSTPSRFANFEALGMQWNVKAGQHTVYWGDSLLLGGAVHGVSYAQNSLDLMKGFGTPGAEAKELFRPKGGITLQTQATKDLSIAGQWFYNWQAVRAPESGSYLTANDALQFGGDSTGLRRESVRGGDSRRAGVHALLEPAGGRRRRATARASATGASRRAGARTGSTARWASTTATRPTSCRRRSLLPGFAALPAATCTAIGGIVGRAHARASSIRR